MKLFCMRNAHCDGMVLLLPNVKKVHTREMRQKFKTNIPGKKGNYHTKNHMCLFMHKFKIN